MPDRALQLFYLTQIFIALMLPLIAAALTWRLDRRAAIWFGGGVYYSIYVILLSTRGQYPPTASLLPPFILWSYMGLLIHVLRDHLGKRTWMPAAFIAAAVVTLAQAQFFSLFGLRASLTLQSLLVMAGDGYVTWIAIAAARRFRSRSLLVTAMASFLVAAAQILRVEELVFGSGRFALLDFTWKTNTLIISHLLAVIVLNIGYAGFLIEQSDEREAIARQERTKAQEARAIAEAAVRERDHMVMLNSRFMTLSGLSFFTAAIIHELTQPLQSLKLMKERLISTYRDQPELAEDLATMGDQVDACDAILRSLRQLMVTGRDIVESHDLGKLTRKLVPIVRSECELSHIDLRTNITGDAVHAKCNSTLYQRIVFNLVCNAIQALESRQSGPRRIRIDLQQARDTIQLEVWSNTGPAPDLSQLTLLNLFGSTRTDGMGLGLALAMKFSQQWNGTLSAETTQGDDGPGALFKLRLPVAPAPDEFSPAYASAAQ